MRPVRPFYSQRLPGAVFDKEGRTKKAEKIFAVLSNYFQGSLSTLKCLDLGCASGIITSLLAPRFKWIVGIDIDIKALEYARRVNTGHALFLPGNAMNLPFKDEVFDVIIAAHVYEHVPDSTKLIGEIHRILKQEGICFFAAGNRLQLVEPHYRLPLLSILPSAFADMVLQITGRGSHYEEKHLTYWSLKRLVSKFEVFDYTNKILQNPKKYSAIDFCKAGSLKQKAAILFSRLAYGLVPTYIFLLKKKGS